ncbi:MAG: glycosyltransferase family 2 protein [Acidimicrobiales bacterium]
MVMPTFQRRTLLDVVLHPLLGDPAASEIIVVNDGGTDGSIEMLTGLAGYHERLRPLDVPRGGRQAARRAGIESATGDIVLLLDDDVRAGPELVGGHAAAHASGRAEVVEGFMPVALPTRRPPGAAPTYLYAEEYDAHCRRLEIASESVLFHLWGGNISLPRSLALSVTAEDDFPASFGEDTHFGLMCHRRGARGIFDRSLGASHLHKRTMRQFLSDAYEQGAGAWWLHHLHGDLLGTLDPEEFLGGMPRFARYVVSALESRDLGTVFTAGATLAWAASEARWFAAEMAVARALRRLSARQGLADASQRVPLDG